MELQLLQLAISLLFAWFVLPALAAGLGAALGAALGAIIGQLLLLLGMLFAGIVVLAWGIVFLVVVTRRVQ